SADGTTFALAGVTTETLNPGILTADRWYYREVTSTLSAHACTEITNTVHVRVNNFDPGTIRTAQTICEGGDPATLESDVAATFETGAALTYQWRESTDGVTFTNISVDGTSETYDPPVLTQDTWYKRAVTSTMGTSVCTEETGAIRISVNNFNPGSISADQTICLNTTPATMGGVMPTGDGSFTYQWQDSPDGSTFTNISGANSATYNPGPLATTTWYRRLVTSTLNTLPCTEASANDVKITINNVDPGTIGSPQTICEGSAPALLSGTVPTGDGTLTYQWQSSIDNIAYTNITGATSATYLSGSLTQDTWFRRQVTSTLNGVSCGETSPEVKITVINFNPGSIAATQTVCPGEVPAEFVSVAPAGDGSFTFEWESSPDNGTYTTIPLAAGETYTPTALTSDTWFRRVVHAELDGQTCTKYTAPVMVFVNNFIPGSIASEQTICEGSMPVPLTSVTPTGDGSFSYKWLSSTDGTTFDYVTGALYETFSPGSLASDTWYRREVTSTFNGKSCSAITNDIRITVNNFVPGSISGEVTICAGSTPAAFGSIPPSGDATSYSFQWKSSTDGINFTDISGATSEVYPTVALNNDTWYKRIVTGMLNGTPCMKETNVVKVTVNNVNAGTIISDQTICIGADPVTFWSIVPGSGDGTITFEWQSSTDNITFTPIPLANAMVYDSPAITTDTWFRRVTKSLLNGVECTAVSNAVKITVNNVEGGTIGSDQAVCYGSSPAGLTSADDGSATGTISYQWMRSSDNVIFSTIPLATSTTYTPGALYADTWYKRTIMSIRNGVICADESNTIKISVNPLPMAILTGGATICPGESASLSIELTAGAGPYDVTLNNTIVVDDYTSGSPISVSPLATTTYRITRVRDDNGCEINDPHGNIIGSALVTVRALPTITGSPANRTICEYGATTFTAAATGSDITWQWQVDKGTGTFEDLADGGAHFGATNQILNIFGGTRELNGYRYRAVATACGTSVNSDPATLTVNTSPVIETQPVESTVCSGENTTFTVEASGTGLGFQWQVRAGAGFTNIIDGGIYSGATTATLTLTGVTASYNNYIYRVIVSGTCPSPAYSNFVILRVNTPPVVTLNPQSKAICAEAGTTYFLANGTGLTSMKWQIDEGGAWTDIDDNDVYSGTNTQQLTFINPPVSLNGRQFRMALTATCATIYTNPATLTVNSNPVVTFNPNPLTNCGGTELTMTPVIAGGSGTWTTHNWSGDVGPLSRYDVQSPVFRTLISGPYQLTYKVKDNNGCFGSGAVMVNVDTPDANYFQDVQSGCTPLTVEFIKDMTGIASWSWDFGDGSPLNTTDESPQHVYVNNEPSALQYRTVKLTVRSTGGCVVEKTSMVTVWPQITASFTANHDQVCNGEMIIFTAQPGGSSYIWDFGDGVTSSGTNIASHIFNNLTGDAIVRTVKVTATSFYGCSTSATLNVTILPKPIAAFSAAPVQQIFNSAGNNVVFTNETNAGSYTWAWRFGDDGASAEKNPSHVYTNVGQFDVMLKVTNNVCSDSVKHRVSVNPIPPVASFDNIPSGCEPLEFTINNTSQYADIPGTTYSWTFGDGGSSVSKNPQYTYHDPGIYIVELTIYGPGGISKASQTVHVYSSPVANFDVAPTFVFVNDEVVRVFNLTEADYFVWEWGDGDTSRSESPVHKYMEPGIFDISLSAYKDNGDGNICFDKFTLSPAVTVEPAGELRFSSVFRPNMGGPIDVDELPTGGDEIDQFFFPPIREKVQDYKLQIFNRLGVLIFESHDINNPWNGYYRGELCPQGVYVWYVEGKYANGQVYKKVGDITLLH
ncbi:MAG TPA: PKD domain-containing protein, partial [Bacteroidales bacterium]|nr:PKD domain-containing protein [Bacteroidales bacterium]